MAQGKKLMTGHQRVMKQSKNMFIMSKYLIQLTCKKKICKYNIGHSYSLQFDLDWVEAVLTGG